MSQNRLTSTCQALESTRDGVEYKEGTGTASRCIHTSSSPCTAYAVLRYERICSLFCTFSEASEQVQNISNPCYPQRECLTGALCQVGDALPSGGFKYMTAVVAPSGCTAQVLNSERYAGTDLFMLQGLITRMSCHAVWPPCLCSCIHVLLGA